MFGDEIEDRKFYGVIFVVHSFMLLIRFVFVTLSCSCFVDLQAFSLTVLISSARLDS